MMNNKETDNIIDFFKRARGKSTGFKFIDHINIPTYRNTAYIVNDLDLDKYKDRMRDAVKVWIGNELIYDSGDHIHVPDDGRGDRYIFVNGKLIPGAFFADTKRGYVDAYMQPTRLDKYRKRVLWRRIWGNVVVVLKP